MSIGRTLGLALSGVGVVGVGAWGYMRYFGSPFADKLSDAEQGILEGFKLPENCKKLNQPCSLDKNQLKGINFSNKNDGDLTIQDNAKINLTVLRTSDKEKNEVFTGGLKFILSVGGSDVEIKQSASSDDNKINLKANTKYEFKKNNDGKLELAWKNGEDYASKIGLKNCNTAGTQKSFSLSRDKFNVLIGGNKFKEVSAKAPDKSKNINFHENEGGHLNGFKFSTPEEIKLEKDGQEIGKLEKEDTATYQIQFDGDDWYLTKK